MLFLQLKNDLHVKLISHFNIVITEFMLSVAHFSGSYNILTLLYMLNLLLNSRRGVNTEL